VIARDRATDDNACAATIRRNAHRHVHNKYRIDEAARWSVDADAHIALALPGTVNKHDGDNAKSKRKGPQQHRTDEAQLQQQESRKALQAHTPWQPQHQQQEQH
jgi:hypothetical protein